MTNDMAKKIHTLRKDKGLTLEQVASVVGVGKSTVRKWETGMIANMRRDKIALLAEALGTTPSYLMGWNEEEEKTAEQDGLSDVDREFIRLFLLLPDEKKKTLADLIKGLSSNQ